MSQTHEQLLVASLCGSLRSPPPGLPTGLSFVLSFSRDAAEPVASALLPLTAGRAHGSRLCAQHGHLRRAKDRGWPGCRVSGFPLCSHSSACRTALASGDQPVLPDPLQARPRDPVSFLALPGCPGSQGYDLLPVLAGPQRVAICGERACTVVMRLKRGVRTGPIQSARCPCKERQLGPSRTETLRHRKAPSGDGEGGLGRSRRPGRRGA